MIFLFLIIDINQSIFDLSLKIEKNLKKKPLLNAFNLDILIRFLLNFILIKYILLIF